MNIELIANLLHQLKTTPVGTLEYQQLQNTIIDLCAKAQVVPPPFMMAPQPLHQYPPMPPSMYGSVFPPMSGNMYQPNPRYVPAYSAPNSAPGIVANTLTQMPLPINPASQPSQEAITSSLPTVKEIEKTSVEPSQVLKARKVPLPTLVGSNDPLLIEALKSYLMCRTEMVTVYMQHQYWFKYFGGTFSSDINISTKSRITPDTFISVLLGHPQKLDQPNLKKYHQRFSDFLYKNNDIFESIFTVFYEVTFIHKMNIKPFGTQFCEFLRSEKNRQYLLDLKVIKKKVLKDSEVESNIKDSETESHIRDPQYHKVKLIFDKYLFSIQNMGFQIQQFLLKTNLKEIHQDYILKNDIYVTSFGKYTNIVVTLHKKTTEKPQTTVEMVAEIPVPPIVETAINNKTDVEDSSNTINHK